jgi:drug/metabolite transporter (DMT)-like permease
MSILFGLSAALAWGLADFCARFAAHRVGNFRTLLYMQLVGLAGLSLWMALAGWPDSWDWPVVGLAGVLAVINTLAGLALYRSFEVGLLSVVSPIAASYGAISLILALASGQRPSVLALAGLFITILGVVLASADLSFLLAKNSTTKGKKISGGIGWAIAAALCLGTVFWGLGYVTPMLGTFLPAWIFRLLGPPVVLILALPTRQKVALPTPPAWLWILGVAGLDTAAYLLYNLGLSGAGSAVVAVISSLFSAVTVLLARIFLNEKLALNQWAGVIIILAGVGLVSAD